MKSTEYIKLGFKGALRYFSVSLFLLLFLLGLGINLTGFIRHEAWDLPVFWIALVPFMVLLVIFFWWTIKLWNERYFDEYKTDMTGAEFRQVVHITAEELEWKTLKLKDTQFIGERDRDGFVGGEFITIKRTKRKLLINSIKNPYVKNASHSSERNKENRMNFAYNAAALLRGEDVSQLIEDRKDRQKERFWTESEWTPKKWIERIAAYGFTLLFLGLVVLVFPETPLLAVLFLILGGGLGGVYIWSDVTLMRLKRRERTMDSKKPAFIPRSKWM